MNNLFVKTGDTVMVMSGEDKGKTGKVQKAYPSKGKIVVEGVAMVKKHQKPRGQGMQGGSYARSARSPLASRTSSPMARRHARFALARSAALRLTTEKEDMRSD